MKLTTAQALVKFLNSQYVEVDGKEQKLFKGIFTIFGHGNVLGIGQALEQDPGDLEVYQGRNEQGMAHAAIGFAKQNRRRKLIACTSSVGPGATFASSAGRDELTGLSSDESSFTLSSLRASGSFAVSRNEARSEEGDSSSRGPSAAEKEYLRYVTASSSGATSGRPEPVNLTMTTVTLS